MMTIMDAARYFIYLSYNQKIRSLTPLKLQKLLYLAQGWSCVWDGVYLFPEEFVAWKYGPVNESIYDEFKKYKSDEIPEREGIEGRDLDKSDKETLEAVWEEYSDLSAYALVDLTHKQLPWQLAYGKGTNELIAKEVISHYFRETY